MEINQNLFGKTITDFRERVNLSRVHASILLGISSCSLRDVERGAHRAFVGERLEKLIEAYGLTREEAILVRRLSYEDRLLIAPHLRDAHINRIVLVKKQNNVVLLEIGRKLREFRVNLGLSAREVARQINIQPLMLIDIEDGLKAIDENIANKLISTYKLDSKFAEELLNFAKDVKAGNKKVVSSQKKLKAKQVYESIIKDSSFVK